MSESEKEETECKWSEMSARDKANYIIDNITVEPILACYVFPSILAQLATQNLNLEKACRVNLMYSDVVCNALEARKTSNFTKEETQVQQLVAGMSIWRTFLQSSIPAAMIMFLGSWSDRNRRRKPFMLIPIVGEFITSISLMFCAYYFYELPMEVAGFVDSFFPAITGGWMTMFMGIFSYIGDITTEEMRTLRIGIVNVFCSAGYPFGTALSGILFKTIGYYGIFSTSALIYLIGISYAFLRIKEKEPNFSTERSSKIECSLWTVTDFLKDLFSFQHIRETFSVAFKDGRNNRRKRVILLMIVLIVVLGPLHGKLVRKQTLLFFQ